METENTTETIRAFLATLPTITRAEHRAGADADSFMGPRTIERNYLQHAAGKMLRDRTTFADVDVPIATVGYVGVEKVPSIVEGLPRVPIRMTLGAGLFAPDANPAPRAPRVKGGSRPPKARQGVRLRTPYRCDAGFTRAGKARGTGATGDAFPVKGGVWILLARNIAKGESAGAYGATYTLPAEVWAQTIHGTSPAVRVARFATIDVARAWCRAVAEHRIEGVECSPKGNPLPWTLPRACPVPAVEFEREATEAVRTAETSADADPMLAPYYVRTPDGWKAFATHAAARVVYDQECAAFTKGESK